MREGRCEKAGCGASDEEAHLALGAGLARAHCEVAAGVSDGGVAAPACACTHAGSASGAWGVSSVGPSMLCLYAGDGDDGAAAGSSSILRGVRGPDVCPPGLRTRLVWNTTHSSIQGFNKQGSADEGFKEEVEMDDGWMESAQSPSAGRARSGQDHSVNSVPSSYDVGWNASATRNHQRLLRGIIVAAGVAETPTPPHLALSPTLPILPPQYLSAAPDSV